MFLETSALTGENVEETFLKCARSILTKIESGSTTMFHCFSFYFCNIEEIFEPSNQLLKTAVVIFIFVSFLYCI